MAQRDIDLRERALANSDLVALFTQDGHTLKRANGKFTALCPFHADKNPSLSIDPEKQLWKCFGCNAGGSAIDYVMMRDDINAKAAMELLAGVEPAAALDPPARFKVTDTYTYTDAHGRERFRVDRLESDGGRKKFAQYHMSGGRRVNGLDGIQRLLWRLPQVIRAEEVFLAEGEKCVKALERLGCVATTNPGGSGGWMDAYAEALANKHVVVMPDADAPGQKWRDAVLESLAGKVASVGVVEMPNGTNDIADLVNERGADAAGDWLNSALSETVRVKRGADVPILSAEEARDKYVAYVNSSQEHAVDLSRWLPGLRQLRTRPCMPGDLIVIIADTGVGKTAAMQNIGVAMAPMPTIMFQLELSATQMAERNMALTHCTGAWSVEQRTRNGERLDVDAWSHIYTCELSFLSIDAMRDIAKRASLKIGESPRILMVDYVGLVNAPGKSRYERVSNAAEQLKSLAKDTDTVVICNSQMRRDPEKPEVDLHDAKDSGSIENSAQLVLGMWRPEAQTIMVKKLKDTKGSAGGVIPCDYYGDQYRIAERERPDMAFDVGIDDLMGELEQ